MVLLSRLKWLVGTSVKILCARCVHGPNRSVPPSCLEPWQTLAQASRSSERKMPSYESN